jgi:hypothetical protein
VYTDSGASARRRDSRVRAARAPVEERRCRVARQAGVSGTPSGEARAAKSRIVDEAGLVEQIQYEIAPGERQIGIPAQGRTGSAPAPCRRAGRLRQAAVSAHRGKIKFNGQANQCTASRPAGRGRLR